MRHIKEGEKKASCIYIDSELKLCGFMMAKARGLSFSEFIELLILEQYIKDMDLIDNKEVD